MNDVISSDRDAALIAAMIEALRDPALVVGADKKVMAANAAAQALLGFVRVGDTLALSLRSPDVLDAVSHVQAGLPSQVVTWRQRVPVERVFEASIAAIKISGLERHVLLTLRDLTEGRRVERMRVDFIANVSHELRTPLASVLGFIETLQGAARDDAVARNRFLDIMRDQARRMARLIDDLLSLSRIEQNEHIHPDTPVDLVGVVGHVVDTLTPVAQDNLTRFDLQMPKTLMVRGDRDELVRLAENLIENAVKYGAHDNAETCVTIVVRAEGTQAIFSVKDQGPGIAPEHLPRLTERFYRVNAGASRAKGGTGLGLALVKHVVARHRGRLSIESRPGEGATFRVTLPLDAVQPA